MLRTILIVFVLGIEMLLILLFYAIDVILELISKKAGKAFVYFVSRYWSLQALAVGGVKLEVKGKEHLPQSNKIAFISNHQSYLDIPVLLAALPKFTGFIAKTELNKMPFINIWMRSLKCAIIDRSNSAESMKKIQNRIRLAEKGYPIVLFPEGTRSRNGQLRRFKTGGISLFYNSGLILVPVTIDGSHKLIEDKRLKRGKVTVTIHQPIYEKKAVAKDYKEMTEYCRETIESGFRQRKIE
jgi:1-acyl-sn-glycerol-3-phosphate acyltransferase